MGCVNKSSCSIIKMPRICRMLKSFVITMTILLLQGMRQFYIDFKFNPVSLFSFGVGNENQIYIIFSKDVLPLFKEMSCNFLKT